MSGHTHRASEPSRLWADTRRDYGPRGGWGAHPHVDRLLEEVQGGVKGLVPESVDMPARVLHDIVRVHELPLHEGGSARRARKHGLRTVRAAFWNRARCGCGRVWVRLVFGQTSHVDRLLARHKQRSAKVEGGKVIFMFSAFSRARGFRGSRACTRSTVHEPLASPGVAKRHTQRPLPAARCGRPSLRRW